MRVALVTGAAGGIGSATVARLRQDGYAVIAFDIQPGVAQLAADLVIPVAGDVRSRSDLEHAAGVATQRWGRLDAVVAAAAVIGGGHPLWETPDDEFDRLWAVDAKGVWLTAAVTVPLLLAGPDPQHARFVAIASAAGSHGLFHLAGYTAVKHAVVGLVRALSADLAGTGVTAVAVSPGSTRTPMLDQTAALYGLDSADDLVAHQSLQRVLEPEELAATIAFCCSPEGAVLNGSVVSADGGFRG